MPLVGVNQAADDIIDIISMDIHGSNGNDLMANKSGSDNGTLTKRNKARNEIPENKTTLVHLLMHFANSGNEKHVKLASDLMDLDLIQGNASDNLSLNGSDKISVPANGNQNSEHETTLDNNTKTNMEWTTVKPKNKRVWSNSNDSEKINPDITVSRSKKQKSTRPNIKDVKPTGNRNNDNNRKQSQGQSDQNTKTKSGIRVRNALIRDSVLVAIIEIPENTYPNSTKMENMILNSFPKLKETGMWTKYRINKRHQCKCYVTLPKDHLNENISEVSNRILK